jgi:hypothetical protein
LYLYLLSWNRGEWHTYPANGLLPDATKRNVYTWYKNAFQQTKLQTRDPLDAPGGGIGFHDDSFAFSTVRLKLILYFIESLNNEFLGNLIFRPFLVAVDRVDKLVLLAENPRI